MKRTIITFFSTLLISVFAYSQEQSEKLFEYITKPQNNKIEVFVNLIDGKINTEKPFTYFKKGTNNTQEEIPVKELKKELRLKLKPNKELGDDCYYIQLRGFKDFKISANYAKHSKNTSIFFKAKKAWNDIEKITFIYKDQKEKKLESIKIDSKNRITGTLNRFEFKK